jgi:hypothetical protein
VVCAIPQSSAHATAEDQQRGLHQGAQAIAQRRRCGAGAYDHGRLSALLQVSRPTCLPQQFFTFSV